MSRFPEYAFSDPFAIKLLNQQLQARGHDKNAAKALFSFLDALRTADSRIAIIVKNGDTRKGTNITVKLAGRKKVIIWVDILTTIGCKIDINGKSNTLFPDAKPCNFHNNCGEDAVKLTLTPDTLQTALDYVFIAYNIKPHKSKTAPLREHTKAVPKPTMPASRRAVSNAKLQHQQLPQLRDADPSDYEPKPTDPDFSAEEGAERHTIHRAKERNQKLVIEKKKQALKNDPLLRCEVCHFSFVQAYGKWGLNFAEVHHKSPLSSLLMTTKTRLVDLAIVCSNCHSMLHRQGHRTLTIAELKTILAQQKSP
jgi:hypothetical protein